MKKTFRTTGIVLMLTVALMAIACTNEQSNANKLVGKWVCTANTATNPHSEWGAEVDGSLKGQTITFRTDGTFAGTTDHLLEQGAEGYWTISESHLYTGNSGWRIKSFTETSLKVETFYVEEKGLTYDTTKALVFNGPFTREFKKE